MLSYNISEYNILGLHFLRLMHFAAAYIHKYFCSIIACQNKSVFLICVCVEGCPYCFLSISKDNNRTIAITQHRKLSFFSFFFPLKNQRMCEKMKQITAYYMKNVAT